MQASNEKAKHTNLTFNTLNPSDESATEYWIGDCVRWTIVGIQYWILAITHSSQQITQKNFTQKNCYLRKPIHSLEFFYSNDDVCKKTDVELAKTKVSYD